MGFNDMEDYELRLGNDVIMDDDMVIDDSTMREPMFDLKFHLYLEEDRKVYYYLPKPKTKEEKILDLNYWYWSSNGDTIKFNTSVNSFNIQVDKMLNSNLEEVDRFAAV
jgi:hypothetical protein